MSLFAFKPLTLVQVSDSGFHSSTSFSSLRPSDPPKANVLVELRLDHCVDVEHPPWRSHIAPIGYSPGGQVQNFCGIVVCSSTVSSSDDHLPAHLGTTRPVDSSCFQPWPPASLPPPPPTQRSGDACVKLSYLRPVDGQEACGGDGDSTWTIHVDRECWSLFPLEASSGKKLRRSRRCPFSSYHVNSNTF